MHSREMTNAASLVVGKAGVWVTDSLVVSLAPGDLFPYPLLGQGSQSDISYQTCLLGWSKPISLSNLPSAKEGWSKYFFPLRSASIWVCFFFLIIFQVLQGFVPEQPQSTRGALDFDVPRSVTARLMLQAFVF